MKTEIVSCQVKSLTLAPWNPRGEITPESVADLMASIRKKGLLQFPGVWRNTSGLLTVIFGNRRVVACRELGMKTVTCREFTCSEAEARELARIENQVRIGVDALKDADLLGEMRNLGLTEQEIAAHFGVSLATVCRRLKLRSLSSCWREVAASEATDITVDALEHIAVLPADIQEAAFKKRKGYGFSGSITWANLEYCVDELLRDLDRKCFGECAKCLKRTGAQPDLFGGLAESDDGKLGKCLDAKCWERHRKEELEKKVDDSIDPRATERVKLSNGWAFDECGAKKKKPTKANPCAYYYQYQDGRVKVKYGPSKAERKRREAEEKARIQAEHQAGEAKRALEMRVHDSIVEFIEGNIGGGEKLLDFLDREENKHLWAPNVRAQVSLMLAGMLEASWGHDGERTEFVRVAWDLLGITHEEMEEYCKPGENSDDDSADDSDDE